LLGCISWSQDYQTAFLIDNTAVIAGSVYLPVLEPFSLDTVRSCPASTPPDKTAIAFIMTTINNID
jgi:hypothetical protein